MAQRVSGFTLLELLVVLAIMGIALGWVSVQWMPDDRARLREEAERLALLLENAALEARASGRSLAWSAQENGYLFWQKNRYQDWVSIEEEGPFRARELPQGIWIESMWLENVPLKVGDRMVLSASALTLPYRIRLRTTSAQIEVQGKSTGEVILANTH